MHNLRVHAALFAALLAGGVCSHAAAQDLIVDGTTITLGGNHTYVNVRVINGGHIRVPDFDGIDRVNTGNLQLVASSIFVDATSSIDARGSGYHTSRCADGGAPAAAPAGAGQGGCAVKDSGGGGAHFGNGGRGTKDCPATTCLFPRDFEEDCGNTLNGSGTSCTSTASCWNNDALPSVAGQAYRHSIYDVEFGASGGDKGCRDGDGFGGQPAVGGAGGGRIVLVALTPAGTGLVDIEGTVSAAGRRGCGTGNDSAGGGAGGSLFIVGDTVQAGPTALVTAAGGLGGDTSAGAVGSPDYQDCPAGAQTGGTCDDCGGGGGGGIISVQSTNAMLDYSARFDVRGAVGGTCAICQGEAGGGAGELQLTSAFVGEVCDGYDNDFNGVVDDGLPLLPCGMPSCVGGLPQTCPVPTCGVAGADTRPRLAVILDTSGSMLTDLSGLPTYGDGTVGHVGADANGDGIEGNDSKLFIAKSALFDVFAGYPEIDYALARYHQDESLNRSCQLAHWLECQSICCSYDDPRDNTPPAATPACSLDLGGSGTVASVNRVSTDGGECINYAGTCGPPQRGADFLVGFDHPQHQLLMWLDGTESNFDPSTTEGDYCNYASGGDCELRGTGPTPLAGALQSADAYMSPIRTCDTAAACRDYGVILLTDGAESCDGDPVGAATALYAKGIRTYVIGFSVLAGETAQLDAIAMAGSGGTLPAYIATDRVSLSAALADIVGNSLRIESCNGLDDNCNAQYDEGFPLYCDRVGGVTTVPNYTSPHPASACSDPGETRCDGFDDNCNGTVDEGSRCTATRRAIRRAICARTRARCATGSTTTATAWSTRAVSAAAACPRRRSATAWTTTVTAWWTRASRVRAG
ncbi:MAG: VWA domain-containing protein, partial [Myxococcales bacterium]|nr:VWA domain-containing protein [Myxococcales bacterium]